jgi:predicted CopG family antitoxin
MGTRHIRLDEDVYAKIKDKKREDETFSEAVDRLTDDWRLSEWGTDRTESEVADHQDALDELEETTRADVDEHLDAMGSE